MRPQKNLTGDGSYFFQGMGGSHELKFGFSYRDMKTHSATIYSGNQLTGHIDSATNIYSRLYRGTDLNYGGKYTNFYVGDMFTKDRFTFNIGVRCDMQTARNLASAAPENATFPERLPAAEFPGNDENLQEWNIVSPRLGLSYALDESRRTIVRASFARYYEQLAFGNVTRENPTSVGYLQYGWNDANGDRSCSRARSTSTTSAPRRTSTWPTPAPSPPTRSTSSTATGSPARTTSSSSGSTVSSARASRPAWRSPTARATTGRPRSTASREPAAIRSTPRRAPAR